MPLCREQERIGFSAKDCNKCAYASQRGQDDDGQREADPVRYRAERQACRERGKKADSIPARP